MNGITWTADEIACALAVDFDTFHQRYPNRSRSSYMLKRQRQHRGDDWMQTSTRPETDAPQIRAAKPAPEVEAPPPTLSREQKWDALIEWQKANDAAFPKPKLVHDVKLEADGPICVCFPSDWHIGNEGTDHARLRADNELIARHPYLYTAIGGDPVDNYVLAKLLSASRTQIAQVKWQWDIFREEVTMLRDANSLLWVGEGNHDAWTRMVSGIDAVDLLLRGVGILPNTKEGALVNLTVGQQTYHIWRKHRPAKYTSSFNRTHFLKRMLELGTPWEWDVGISEHLHVWDQEEMEWRPGTGKDRHLLCCGSYKIYDSYAHDWGLYGGGYGVPAVLLWPDKRLILSFAHLHKALLVLDALRGQ